MIKEALKSIMTRFQHLFLRWFGRWIDPDPSDEFMGDTSAKHARGAHPVARTILWLIILFLIIGLIWAKLAVLNEVAVGEGKVIPASQVQIIQNLEGGIVEKIYVHEGDIVEKDQMLMQLNNTQFASDYSATQLKLFALQATIARLNAVLTDEPFEVAPDLQVKIPDLVAHEQQLFESQEREIKQKTDALALIKKEYDMTKPLVAQGAASDVELLHLQRSMADLNGEIDAFKSHALEDLNKAKGDLLTTNELLGEYKDKFNRTTIRSPVKGIVKEIKVSTIGGVSQPGMDLLEIVPLEDTLLIEAKIDPKDIGFIHIGQSATVKITAYDYSIYGSLKGEVENISADTISNDRNTVNDPKQKSFYQIRVRTHQNYLGTKAHPLYIIPGMQASVDILTGRKSVLNYLLKPILKTAGNALKER